MSKIAVEPEGPQTTSQYGAYALHAGQARLHARTQKYVILAFPRQQWDLERNSLLRYSYISCRYSRNASVSLPLTVRTLMILHTRVSDTSIYIYTIKISPGAILRRENSVLCKKGVLTCMLALVERNTFSAVTDRY